MISRRWFVSRASGIGSVLSFSKLSLGRTVKMFDKQPTDAIYRQNDVQLPRVLSTDRYTKTYFDSSINTIVREYIGKIRFSKDTSYTTYDYMSDAKSLVPILIPGYERVKANLQLRLYEDTIIYETKDILVKSILDNHA